MSMHFAPQWIKPIKPSGTSITPTAESPNQSKASAQVPFPALSSTGSSHPTVPSNSGLSYSRATHTPTTPGFPTDSSYFPYTEPNGSGANGEISHPFRYSRDQILGLWDEQKVRKMPIELVDMLEGGGVLASRDVVRPNGLRELTEIEKKLLSSSVHPPNPTRRQAVSALPNDPAIVGGPISRRTIGATSTGDKPNTPGRIGGSAFGGFGTGKIGTIGGGMLSPGANPEGRMPGALGGGFGGVGRRTARRPEAAEAGGAWRPSRTASGNFEGVLGFGGPAPAPAPAPAPVSAPAPPLAAAAVEPSEAPQSPWKEKGEQKEKVGEVFGSGGGPGWGTGQKKWRIAAGLLPATENEKPHTISIPISTHESISESVAASASATPLPERDATVEETASRLATPVPASQSLDSAPPAQEKEDLGAIEWFYRDPGGQEQGPFTGSQMHEWYSHAYFTDDLPLRRSAETGFHTLAELKTATGNAVQPFLSAVRPRLPPNLPLPLSVPPAAPINGMTDSLRNLGLSTPLGAMAQQPQFNQYMPNPAMHSPNHFASQNAFGGPVPSSAGPYLPSPGQWGAPVPRLNTFGSAGAVGAPSPIGSAPLAYPHHPQMPPQPMFSPVIGAHVQSREFFSPSIGVGAHATQSPWGAPQPPPQPQFISQPAPNAWHGQPQQQQPQQQFQQPPQPIEPAPPLPQEPSYFPENEQYTGSQEVPASQAMVAPEPEVETEVEAEASLQEGNSTESEPIPETPAPVEESPIQAEPTPAPVSVWGRTPTASAPASRRTSITNPAAPTPAQAAKTSATPTVTATKPAPVVIPETPEKSTEKAAERTPASARPAPWADKEGRTASTTGPSLREIQDAEAKQAEARKAARAAAASPAPVANSTSDELPANLTWGLPTSQKAAAPATPSVSTPVAAWGSGDAAPKKTLKQIQEEEEKRKQKAAQGSKAAAGSGPAVTSAAKRGYADLAATSQAPAAAAGWTTVGTKPATPSAVPAARPTVASIAKPATPAKSTVPAAIKPKSNGIDESTSPSLDFIRWTKQSLTGLTVNVDEFIQMLLTFPIDPPAGDRAGVLEIISDSVYASSSTLDGRRFAQEFFTRRKADAARPKATSTGVAKSSLADVVKSVPKKAEEAGFRVVKAKGKKKN